MLWLNLLLEISADCVAKGTPPPIEVGCTRTALLLRGALRLGTGRDMESAQRATDQLSN